MTSSTAASACTAAMRRKPSASRSRSRSSERKLKSTEGAARQSADASFTSPALENGLFTYISIVPMRSPTACHDVFVTTETNMSPRRRAADARRIAPAEQDVPAGRVVHAGGLAKERSQRDRRMLHQMLPDAVRLRDDRDAMLAQMLSRADARAQQDRGRLQRARREDDFPRAHFRWTARRFEPDAAALRPFEQQAGDFGVGPDRQVRLACGSAASR